MALYVTGLWQRKWIWLGLLSSIAAAMGAERFPSVTLSPQELNLINRITWGANPSTANEFKTLGPEKFLSGQLNPQSDSLPAPAQEQIDGLSISRTPLEQIVGEAEQQAKIANAIADQIG